MSISSRISAMQEHLRDDYDVLNLAGADLTNVDKNILNLKPTWKERLLYFMNNGTDEVWNNWDKVTGEGEEISLNNTLEAKMGIELKGNTSQETTTGKNLVDLSNAVGTKNGVTFTLENGVITLNGTSTAQTIIILNNVEGDGSTYTTSTNIISGSATGGLVQTYIPGTLVISKSLNASGSTSGTLQSGITYTNRIVIENNTSFTNLKVQIQLEKNNTATSWEPYTNGASPNPDYPQDIHVVSGDNSIEVCGKNLIPFTNQDFTLKNVRYYVNNGSLILNGTSTGETLRQSADFKTHFSFYLEPGTYMFRTKSRTTNIPIYVSKYSDDTIISNINGNTLNNKTFTLTEKTQVYLSFYIYNQVFENDNLELMLELGNQATTYEAYKGATYPINLGVENLWKSIPSATKNGVTLTYNDDGSYTLNGTSTAATSFYTTVSYPIGTYSLSANNSQVMLGGADYLLLETSAGGSANKRLVFSIQNHSQTYNVTSPITAVVIVISSGKTYNNFVIKPQLEKGSKVNSFSKYGTTPIELCKIGDYQDKFIRNSGKNLFDYNDLLSKIQTFTIAGDEYHFTTTGYGTYQYPISITTNAIISGNWSTTNLNGDIKVIYVDDTNENIFSSYTSTYASGTISFIPTKEVKAIQFRTFNSNNNITINNFMINLGTTALPYEPYGSGLWYKKSNLIKKTIGSTYSWSYYSTGQYFYNTSILSDLPRSTSGKVAIPFVCSHFKDENLTGLMNIHDNSMALCQQPDRANEVNIKMSSVGTSADDLKTWLGNNLPTLMYPLDYYSFTKITDETLINQLEKLSNAKSYNSQTNISQQNNDNASIMSAVALSE